MDHEERDHLSRLVRERREARGLSVNKLAAACMDILRRRGLDEEYPIHPSWVSRLERREVRQVPDMVRLETLAEALGVAAHEVKEAAGSQFWGLDTVWSPSGKTRTLVAYYDRLSEEDQAKVMRLLEHWGDVFGQQGSPES